ncbi:cytochrome P450 [Coprinopsis cinerea okayama7|uniref:Cytochrome P450 n=1 Tax=Coprinopsis cinerea (strain Okayama-7 / 130 / ATCC MYA-4618 / FGSC 9003) TaxID=240176 RepID=D6RNL1_COPC7|nr:cytochrome P450 [Coprinopsis cinerea okayama7\|eukprot:XP_002910921.1 cytochrome P450 [Coprinopsis cinerea okayama7\
MHDPNVFENPMEFKPERYLKDGVIDSTVLDPESGAFGYGRRICPGRYFGIELLTLYVASLLAVYDIKPAKDDAGNPIPIKLEIDPSLLLIV